MSPDFWMSSSSKSLTTFNEWFEWSVGSVFINMSIALITALFNSFFGTVWPFAALTNGPNSTKPDRDWIWSNWFSIIEFNNAIIPLIWNRVSSFFWISDFKFWTLPSKPSLSSYCCITSEKNFWLALSAEILFASTISLIVFHNVIHGYYLKALDRSNLMF